MWGDLLRRFLRRDHWDYFEVDDVGPIGHPLVDQAAISGSHYLIAAFHSRIDPARDVADALRGKTTTVPKAAVHRDGVPVLEPLDDHEEHGTSCVGRVERQWIVGVMIRQTGTARPSM